MMFVFIFLSSPLQSYAVSKGLLEPHANNRPFYNAASISKGLLESLINNRPFYNAAASQCTAGSGGSGDAQSAAGGGNSSSGVSQSKADFLKKYAEMAYKNSLKTGVPYEFTLAQAILEGALTSQLALKYNNLFGVKAGPGWHGKTVNLPTTEEDKNGNRYRVMASWRVYDNPEDSFADHDSFLRDNPRYAKAFQYSNDPFKFLAEVRAAGYATDVDYVAKVSKVIQEVIDWVAKNTSLPPSSGIKYDVPPPTTDNTDSSSSQTANSGGSKTCSTDAATPAGDVGGQVGGDTGGDNSSSPTGTAQELAQQLLDNPNVSYPYKDTKGLTVREVLQHIVKTGKGIVNSPDVSFTEVAVSTKLLQALVDYAKTNKIGLNALTNADHSSGSNHYKGIAVDLACVPNLDRSAFEAVASKYGGKNNGETCPSARHWHYDFK